MTLTDIYQDSFGLFFLIGFAISLANDGEFWGAVILGVLLAFLWPAAAVIGLFFFLRSVAHRTWENESW